MNTPIEKIKLDIKWAMASRTSILMLSTSFIISDILYPLLIYGIYQKYQIPGWSVSQILFMFGVFLFIYGTTDTFFNSLRWEVTDEIKSGVFDYRLIRPKGIFKQEGLSLFIPTINDIITGLILIILFLNHGNLLNLISLISLAIIFLFGLNILIIGLSFKYISVDNLWIITERFYDVSHWPIKIFPCWVRILVMVFPVVLVGYAPAYAYFFGNLNRFIVPIISSIIFLIGSIIYFNYALKRYSSAGG